MHSAITIVGSNAGSIGAVPWIKHCTSASGYFPGVTAGFCVPSAPCVVQPPGMAIRRMSLSLRRTGRYTAVTKSTT